MFGINEILNKVINKKPLTEEEKFKILHSKRVDKKVVEYLINRLSQLHIEVLGKYEGSLFELMPVGKLEGWCWQTTESAIVFFNDNDYIERGNLNFDERTPQYYHSWICFDFNGTEYVLDPCLSFLCKKSDYSKIFQIDVKGKVTAKAVREELIRQITAPKKEDNSESHKKFDTFLKNFLGDSYESYQRKKKEEVVVDGPEDPNTPLYRNGAGYKTEIANGKIKKMTVHYYYTDC
ncbi:MAG: hypothetical protein IJB83_04940 [Bacilli bacterium]|nr:hypothetical protein [Bacilli bacterium]